MFERREKLVVGQDVNDVIVVDCLGGETLGQCVCRTVVHGWCLRTQVDVVDGLASLTGPLFGTASPDEVLPGWCDNDIMVVGQRIDLGIGRDGWFQDRYL
jgi:hypothetical protein